MAINIISVLLPAITAICVGMATAIVLQTPFFSIQIIGEMLLIYIPGFYILNGGWD